MNRASRCTCALLLLSMLLAACGPTPAAAPTQAAAVPPTPTAAPLGTPAAPTTAVPPQPTAVQVQATAAPTEATTQPAPERIVLGQAGLACTPPAGYTVGYDYEKAWMTAPGAGAAGGPLIVIDSNALLCAESVPVSLWDAFERARDCLPWQYGIEEAEATEPVEVEVDGRLGYAGDIAGTAAGEPVRLHYVVLKPGTERVIVLLALATAERYAEVAGPFEDLVRSIDLLTWSPYTYANDVQDVIFYEGYLWAATSGGVVNYGLGGGLLPEKYTTVDGLPANDVRALVACPVMGETVLVAGTWGGGLAWFDMGLRRWFDMGGAFTEWHSGYVTMLACVPERRRLIVGYRDGLDIYDADEVLWTFVSSEAGLPDGLHSLAAGLTGEEVWAIGRTEVARIGAGGQPELMPTPGEYLGQGAVDGAGNLWIAFQDGLVQRAPDGTWSRYDAAQLPGLANDWAWGVALDVDGAVWLGAAGYVARFDPATAQVTETHGREPGMGAGAITRMAVSEEGWLAYGTSTGASVRRDGEWTFYALEGEPLLNNDIRALAQDTDGRIWVGTEFGGLYRFDPGDPAGRWANFYSELPDPSVNILYADPAGGIWAGHTAGVSYYDGQSWRHLGTELPELAAYYTYAMAQDSRGRLWLGGDSGILIWDGRAIVSLSEAAGLPSGQVRALLPDGEAMWIGTLGGLARWDGEQVTVPEPENGDLPSPAVVALAWTESGALLVASDSYLLLRDADGRLYPLLETSDGSDVVAVAVQGGDVWVTTALNGAYHLAFQGEAADWVHLLAVQGPPANDYGPGSILVDRTGAVWLGGFTGGLARYGR